MARSQDLITDLNSMLLTTADTIITSIIFSLKINIYQAPTMFHILC